MLAVDVSADGVANLDPIVDTVLPSLSHFQLDSVSAGAVVQLQHQRVFLDTLIFIALLVFLFCTTVRFFFHSLGNCYIWGRASGGWAGMYASHTLS